MQASLSRSYLSSKYVQDHISPENSAGSDRTSPQQVYARSPPQHISARFHQLSKFVQDQNLPRYCVQGHTSPARLCKITSPLQVFARSDLPSESVHDQISTACLCKIKSPQRVVQDHISPASCARSYLSSKLCKIISPQKIWARSNLSSTFVQDHISPTSSCMISPEN